MKNTGFTILRRSSGFTIIELIVVITIMGILLVLGVVNLNDAQINARDVERRTNIETIAYNLETFYTSGSDMIESIGQYPSVEATNGLIGKETTYLRDIDANSLSAPDSDTSSLIAATNNTQTIAEVTPQPTIDQYVYQPIATDGSLCDNSSKECRKFNLYYMTESDEIIHMVTSKNQ